VSSFLDTVRGCTFDDFLFTPQHSLLERRDPSSIDLSSRLTQRLTLKRPIVSANMDTITRAEMAIAVAEEGGIGIIDRRSSASNGGSTASSAIRTPSRRPPR
jgi:IMP dehydrogenase